MARKTHTQWTNEAKAILLDQGFIVHSSDHRDFDFKVVFESRDQRRIRVTSRPCVWNEDINRTPRDWIMFREKSGWYLLPHSELVAAYGEAKNGNPLSSKSWLDVGYYSGANLTKRMRQILAIYQLSDAPVNKPLGSDAHPIWDESEPPVMEPRRQNPKGSVPMTTSGVPVTNDRLRPPNFDRDAILLVVLAARYCLMPHPDVVSRLEVVPFPVIRNSGKRGKTDLVDDRTVMYDDNTIPRWAIFWSHGDGRTAHIKGCSIAHVWAMPKDPDAFTNVANLAIIPECLASLTDKDGPLVPFLQYHAQSSYGWRPKDCPAIEKPPGYDCIRWNYIEPSDDLGDPNRYILDRLTESRSRPAECILELITRPTGN